MSDALYLPAPKRLPITARMLLKTLHGIHYGTLLFTTPHGKRFTFEGKLPGPVADIHIHDWSAIGRTFSHGDVGFGETYIDGKWSTSDLSVLLDVLLRNVEAIEAFFDGRWWTRQIFKLTHLRRSNTKEGSRKNIMAHYDVGNDFYSLWLDETMTYSSALYGGDDNRTLADAQKAKYHRLLDRIDTNGNLLEIGCGWGGFAEEAVRKGNNVTGLTLSPSQLEYARKRLADKGLSEQADLRLEDYRDTTGTFDSIVSIEMFEAVGERYWPAYFKTVKERLSRNGKALVQTITIADEEFEGYRNRSDFIRQYIFPGGMLPSITRFTEEAEKAGLKITDNYGFGKDYAMTLQSWLERFEAKLDAIRALGYDEPFIRSWRFYLCYCIAGFATGRTDVRQIELVHA